MASVSPTSFIQQNWQTLNRTIKSQLMTFPMINISSFTYTFDNDELKAVVHIGQKNWTLSYTGREHPTKKMFLDGLNLDIAGIYFNSIPNRSNCNFTIHSTSLERVVVRYQVRGYLRELDFNPQTPELEKRIYDFTTGILYVDRIDQAVSEAIQAGPKIRSIRPGIIPDEPPPRNSHPLIGPLIKI